MDKVVAAVAYRDYVLVFTEQGKIFKIEHDSLYKIRIQVELAQLPVNR
jgi:hypothetical protein